MFCFASRFSTTHNIFAAQSSILDINFNYQGARHPTYCRRRCCALRQAREQQVTEAYWAQESALRRQRSLSELAQKE
eukprot:COSAG06_NODE_24233_length_668_cov_1.741652_1_plen_76_part_01